MTRADNDMKAALSRLDEAVKHRAEAASDERRLLAEVDRIDAAYRLVATDIIAKALAGEREAAVQKMNVECRPLLAQLLAAVAGFIGNEQGQAAEQVAQAQARISDLTSRIESARTTMAQGTEVSLDIENATQAALCDTDDYREGFAAFQQKRPPQFTGR